MHDIDSESKATKLSICITTFNRASFIGATLESILVQLPSDCEVVVLDGGSTDRTQALMFEYASRFDRLRYFKQETNLGFDHDCDRTVELARGEYCLLMTDDDLFKASALKSVLKILNTRDLSLLILNVELRDFSMSMVLQEKWLHFETDRIYQPWEIDRLVSEVGHRLHYVGGIVIKRAIWLSRERQRCQGSLFAYLSVLFQKPLPGEAQIIAEPLIAFRVGNTHTFSPKMFEVFSINYPAVVWSLALSDVAKSKICSAAPWKSIPHLLWWRGMGCYSLTEYRRWIRPRQSALKDRLAPMLVALLPGALVNALFILYYSSSDNRRRAMFNQTMVLQLLKESRFHLNNLLVFKRSRAGR